MQGSQVPVFVVPLYNVVDTSPSERGVAGRIVRTLMLAVQQLHRQVLPVQHICRSYAVQSGMVETVFGRASTSNWQHW